MTTDILGRVWDTDDTDRRTRVCAALHAANANTHHRVRPLTDEEWISVRLLADGFGRITLETDGAAEMLGDWSHVRDSSPAAFRAMFTYLSERGLA